MVYAYGIHGAINSSLIYSINLHGLLASIVDHRKGGVCVAESSNEIQKFIISIPNASSIFVAFIVYHLHIY